MKYKDKIFVFVASQNKIKEEQMTCVERCKMETARTSATVMFVLVAVDFITIPSANISPRGLTDMRTLWMHWMILEFRTCCDASAGSATDKSVGPMSFAK